jgi:hypothetical protein
MSENPAELLIELSLDNGVPAEMDELTRQLRAGVEELKIDSLERKPSTPVSVKVKVGKRTAQIEYDPTSTSAKDPKALIKALGKSVKSNSL